MCMSLVIVGSKLYAFTTLNVEIEMNKRILPNKWSKTNYIKPFLVSLSLFLFNLSNSEHNA